MRLPVYLIHYDQPEWCASAVASILQSRGVDVEVAVVDNGQLAGPPLGSLLPQAVRLLPMGRNAGYTGGANRALEDWRCRFPDQEELCVIGSHDLHVEPDALARLVDLARRRPDAGIVAPAMVAPKPAAGGTWLGGRPRHHHLDAGVLTVEREWASGTCLMLRRQCVEAVGPFDERLGSYVEDVDYGLRARDAGWKVLVDCAAHVRGLGSGYDAYESLTAVNLILLNAKRRGRGWGVVSLCEYSWATARSAAAAWFPWRDPQRRASSRRIARARARALGDLVRTGRLLAVLRSPHGPVRVGGT